MRAADGRSSWAAQLPVVFGAAVVSFVVATAFTHWQLAAIDRASLDIADNASPSIERLAAARGDMRTLQVVLRDYLDRTTDGTAADTTAVEQTRHSMNQSINDYLNLPVFPGEQKLWGDILRGKDAVNGAVSRCLADVHRPDFRTSDAVNEVAVAADGLGEAITRDVEFNATHSHDLALQIKRQRARSTYMAFGLDGVCALLTLLGAVGLRRAMRAHLDLAERHRRVVDERASELEQFAGTVAHDILSPLGTVNFALQLAARAGDEEKRNRAIAHGTSAIARVSSLVHGLLEFARSGAKPDPDARTEIKATIVDLATALQRVAAEANVELRVDADVASEVRCNAGVLTSLVSNLANNALKYIGDGPIRLVELRAIEQADCVRIEVRDSGPGLAPGLEDRVFDPYVRGDHPAKGGIGLGLATVKRLAEAHGGRAGVHSIPGEGCTFWFELPKVKTPRVVAIAASPKTATRVGV